MTRDQLAAAIGKHPKTIERIENGDDVPTAVAAAVELIRAGGKPQNTAPFAQNRPLALSDVVAYLEAHPESHNAIQAILDGLRKP